MKVTIVGAGIAGLTAGMLLARAGHGVDIFESDSSDPPPLPLDAFEQWARPGVAQYRMPHQLLGRLRRVLLEEAPDVRDRLLAAGATEHDVFRKIPGGQWLPEDEELVTTFVRRPMLEAVLRQAALDSGVGIRRPVRVEGLLVEGGFAAGLRTTMGAVDSDLVVDAAGRRTPVATWLSEIDIGAPVVETSDCGVVYYCRYYRLRDGAEYPDTAYPSGAPLGDLGSLRFNMMRGDNGTYSILLGVSAEDRGLRQLRHEASFEAVLALVPPLKAYLAEDFSEPITDVLSMGDIHNSRRHYARAGQALLPGLVGIGDSYCHTDPLFGWGASFAVAHAAALARAVAQGGGVEEIGAGLEATIGDEADEAFRVATLEDDARTRAWRGESLDLDPDTDIAAFARHVIAPAAAADPVVFRSLMRRIMIFDRPTQMYHDAEVRRRALEHAARSAGIAGAWTPPTRQQVDEAMEAAFQVRPEKH